MPKEPTEPFKTHSDASLKVQALLDIVASLRGPDGCPWDKEQTHLSLTQYAIEESFELVEAIELQIDTKIKEELGDVLFQIVLHAQLASERGAFDFSDIVETLNEKMIRRHPHVFASAQVKTTEDVQRSWEEIKLAEKSLEKPPAAENILNVPSKMPALQRAYKIGKRTEKLQFDWDNSEQVWKKVQEEYLELREALDEKSIDEIEHEMGDVLFSLAQMSRHLGLEPEQVLRKANRRFEARFSKMKEFVSADNMDFNKLTTGDKESYWQKAKKALKK